MLGLNHSDVGSMPSPRSVSMQYTEHGAQHECSKTLSIDHAPFPRDIAPIIALRRGIYNGRLHPIETALDKTLDELFGNNTTGGRESVPLFARFCD